VGGHAAVAGEVVEDVMLARRIKAAGLRLRMIDGNRLVGCRMYRDWPEVRDGFAKNILSGHAGSVLFLALSTLFHWTVFVLPWLLWPLNSWFALLAGVGVLIRGLTAVFTRQRALDALFMPVSVVLMTLIAGRAVWWHYRGGPRWKGRVARV
jgi:chlorobactene glucosyltransferase